MKIGVVGTGRMGANIARHLHDEGYEMAALYDARHESAEELAAEIGGTATTSLTEVAKNSNVILTVVTDDAAMRQIFATQGDSLLSDARGKTFLNCATITPSVHVEIEAAVAERGGDALEACMASSIAQAREGTLYLMIGGSRNAFERVKPLLERMSSSLTYVGGPGRAAQVKALVNMVMNVNTAGLAEGLGLGDALGLDLDMLRTVFSQTGANSRVLETDGADMQHRDHEVYFSAAHAAKDSGIALELAREQRLDLPLAAATLAQFERMKELGLGELDKSGVAELTFKSRRGGAR
jgi:3-hydroxyisobutyrate dehydrogenase-like beta-hydroxyacid dehydrogenase